MERLVVRWVQDWVNNSEPLSRVMNISGYKLRGIQSASELYRLSDRHLSTKLLPTFVDRGVSRGERGGSLTAVNLSFLDRSRYFSFK
jgi:hypothetical protein